MAFTRALYYPSIDIQDVGWLKNAVLYWEEIQTIVPASIRTPYQSRVAQVLAERKILIPLHVEADMIEIAELTEDVEKYLSFQKMEEERKTRTIRKFSTYHSKASLEEVQSLDKHTSRERFSQLHPEKFSYEISSKMQNALLDDWFVVDNRFADFYMTLLATRLSERQRIGLLTNSAAYYELPALASINTVIPASLGEENSSMPKRYNSNKEHSLTQGTLVNLMLKNIKIDERTPIEKILNFKEQHKDELGRFRKEIDRLTKTILDAQTALQSPQQLRYQIEDTYYNYVLPAMGDLEEGLRDSDVKWMTGNVLKIVFSTTASAAPLLHSLGLSSQLTPIIGGCIWVGTSAIQYSRLRNQQRRNSPFSYLLRTKGLSSKVSNVWSSQKRLSSHSESN